MSEGIQSVQRAVTILELVAKDGGRGTRLVDVSSATGLGKSTAYRLLLALVQAGLVEQDPQSKLFYPGFGLLALGAAAQNRYGLADLAEEAMDALAAKTGDTVYLSIRQRNDAVCLARTVGSFPIKTLTLNVGDRRPLGVGAGSLALLAFMDDAEARAVIDANTDKLAGFPGLDAAALLHMVEATRLRGFALNDGRVVAGMSALGVPILGRDGSPVAALSVAAIAARLEGERRATVVQWLQEQAEALGHRLQAATGNLTASTLRKLARASA